ncbi:MAG: ANTAR domain-containing protein [Clostridia bacterium]|nr:ANTAR domain-containing protein [Clostridia bacterium]
MSQIKRLYSVLVASSNVKFCQAVTGLLDKSVYAPIHFESSEHGARRKLSERAYDIVLINAPLVDDFGSRFAADVSGEGTAVSLIFVKAELYDDLYDRLSSRGVFVLKKPINPQAFYQALDFLKSACERLRVAKGKTVTLEEKMKEISLINRAKWVLIKKLGYTEDEAHKYIEKSAMDECVPKLEIAERIIKNAKK